MTADEWTAVGSVATAGIALLAAAFAGWQVWEIRRTREEQARPFVVVDVQSSVAWRNILNLVVENVGSTVAIDIVIRFTPELRSSQKRYDLQDSVLVREGIPTLPPGRRLEAIFDLSHTRLDTDLPMRYDVEVLLKNSRGRQQEPQRYVIDLRPLYGLTSVNEYGIHHAAKSLREIEKSLTRWADAGGRLRVWVRDEDQHVFDERVEGDLTGRDPTLGTKAPPELIMALGRNVLVRPLVRFFWRWLRSGRGRG